MRTELGIVVRKKPPLFEESFLFAKEMKVKKSPKHFCMVISHVQDLVKNNQGRKEMQEKNKKNWKNNFVHALF